MRGRIGRQLAWLVVCLPLAAAPRLADAQTPPPWPGDRVRVSHTDPCCASPQVGRLVSLDRDSLVLTTGRGANETRTALPRRAVVSLERGQEVGTHAGSGTVLGALAGIAAGGAALAYVGGGCEDTGCLGWMLLAPYAIGGGAIVGGIVGRLIGRSVPRIEWRGVALPVRVGVGRPSRDGGLTMRFTLR